MHVNVALTVAGGSLAASGVYASVLCATAAFRTPDSDARFIAAANALVLWVFAIVVVVVTVMLDTGQWVSSR